MDDLPPPTKLNETSQSTENKSGDEPLIKQEFRVNNPFSSFFKWIKRKINSEGITIKPLTAMGIAAIIAGGSGTAAFGAGFSSGFSTAASKFFPDSSPVFHRAISVEGTIQKSSSTKYYLKSGNNSLWTLKPVNPAINLADYIDKGVEVRGNLTKEKLVIEVSEIIPLETHSAETTLAPPRPPQAEEAGPAVDVALPELFSGLQWEKTQKKVLIFTSGRRKIEQEGVYLESAQIASFPQEFINYYIQELQDSKFKETLNSIDPEGITITYAQNDLFLTFGIKNTYSGSGVKKQLVGYRAFIEHN